MEHYQNKYIPILIDEIFEHVLTEEQIIEFTSLRQLQRVGASQNPTPPPHTNPTLKAISDVENNFLKVFFEQDSDNDFGITKILKGEIFDITATSINNTLGILKSEHFEYKTTLEDISGELNYIKRTTQDDKSIKRESRLNFIENCIELDNNDVNRPFNTLFEYLTSYINGSKTIVISEEQFLVKNSGGNIFKLYAELLHLIFEDRIDAIEEEFKNMVDKSYPESNLFKQIKDIMIDMYLEPRDVEQKERYTIYNSLRNNMRLIRLQNYSDIDSYIIQKHDTRAGEGAMETEEPMTEAAVAAKEAAVAAKEAAVAAKEAAVAAEAEAAVAAKEAAVAAEAVKMMKDNMVKPHKNLIIKLDKNNTIGVYLKLFYLKTFKETELLLSDINTIDKIIDKIIDNIESIEYIFQQIIDTLKIGLENIQNIQNIQGTGRQKKGHIKSNFNNTLKEINSIIDNYDKIVRKLNIDPQELPQAPEVNDHDNGFILFRIKSYNKILGFNTEDTKINYNIKELLIKLELINELNKEIVKNINNPEYKYNYLPSYNNLYKNVQEILPSPLYPQVFQADFLKINIDNSQDITNKILGHLFLKSLQYEKEFMRISTDTNSRKLLKSNNFNKNIENLHEIFEAINTSINSADPATAPATAPAAVPDTFTNLSSLLKSNSLIEAMIKALKAFNTKTRKLNNSETAKLIDYNEQYNKNANGVILGKMAKTLLGQPAPDIKDAYNKMIQYIDRRLTDYQNDFKNQLLNFIAIETSDKTEI